MAATAIALAATVAACSQPSAGPPPPWPAPHLWDGGDPSATIAVLPAEMPVMLDRAGVPGLSMAIVSNGGVRWTGAFGVTDVRTRRAMSASTIVEAASLGEPILATVALALVEAGKLDLDTPIAHWFVDPQVGKDPSYGRITLRHLLSHTSGLTNLRANETPAVHFPPGDHFSYSGVGLLVAQRLIEHVAGERIDATAARIVFGPAGMTNSSFVWQQRFEDHTAVGHDANGQPMPKRRPTVPFAPASLQTTAEDYGRFLAALLSGRLLKQPALDQMWTPQIAVSLACVECPGRDAPERSTTVFWGLGWGVDRTASGNVIWQWGDTDVFRSYVVAWPAARSGLVFFTNSEHGLSLRGDLVRHVAGGDHPDWDFVKYDQYDAPETIAMKSVEEAFLRDSIAGAAEYRRQRSLGAVPADPNVLDRLGFTFFTRQQPRTAVGVWELETEEFPRSPHAWDNLGLGYKVLGDAERSTGSYRRALAIDPSDDTAKKALSVR